MLEWSRKLLTRFLKVSTSRSQPRRGIWTPNWCSSSRSPWSGEKVAPLLCATVRTLQPVVGEVVALAQATVTSGGG